MTTIAEIIQRAHEKLALNQDMPGNNCLIYFADLNVRGDMYCGNVMAAHVGNVCGPWKARIYLRLQLEHTDPTSDEALQGLERIVTGWAKKELT